MWVRLLGTAAGGGFPQWNCACPICIKAREGVPAAKPRTQSLVAVSADQKSWFLLNASPDICRQIEAFAPLHPSPMRQTPLQGVLITNSDLDHVLGLFQLREHTRICLFTTPAIRQALCEGLGLERVLTAYTQLFWHLLPATFHPLPLEDGSTSGLLFRALPLTGTPPRYYTPSRQEKEPSDSIYTDGHAVALHIQDASTHKSFLYAPDLACWDETLTTACQTCDLLLIDGTFWEEEEMLRHNLGNRTASQMGHLPISGEGGTLAILGHLPVPHKVYTHINNTNPILLEGSPHNLMVRSAGCLVGEDGMEFVL